MNNSAFENAPHFFVLGAAKAGTTAVWQWLRQHEDVFLPHVKEPRYFAFADKSATSRQGPFDPDYVSEITTDAAAYRALYATADAHMTGDASPIYLGHSFAMQSIAQARPNARIIVLLRQPVKRAFSQYLHHVRDGLEPCDTFEAALAAEGDRMADGWSWSYGYAALGDYPDQLRRLLTVFPRDQVLFVEFESLQTDPATCWTAICAHLGLGTQHVILNEKVNVTSTLSNVPSRPGISRHLKHPGPIQSILKKAVSPTLRAKIRRHLEGSGKDVPRLTDAVNASLTKRYRADVPLIEELTGLSLRHWFPE